MEQLVCKVILGLKMDPWICQHGGHLVPPQGQVGLGGGVKSLTAKG